jgi:2-iminobutanoate/2-iminopropanoate deaminase
MEIIQNDNMPKSNGHYSQCIAHNGILYLSGQLPIDPQTRKIPKTIEDQADLVLSNVESILIAAGSKKEDIIQARVYISDIELWDKVNERYSLFFGDHKPVRCIVPTTALHFDALIEVEVTAVQNSK